MRNLIVAVLSPLANRTRLLTSGNRVGDFLRRRIVTAVKAGGPGAQRAQAVVDRMATRDSRRPVLLAARMRRQSLGLSQSIPLYTEVTQRWPEAVAGHVTLAEHALKAKDRAAAQEHLERAMKASDEFDVKWADVLKVSYGLADRSLAATVAGRIEPTSAAAEVRAEALHLSRVLSTLDDPNAEGSLQTLRDAAEVSPALGKLIVRWLNQDGRTSLLREIAPLVGVEAMGADLSGKVAKRLSADGEFTASTTLARAALATHGDLPGLERVVEVGESALGVLREGWTPSERAPEPAYEPLPKAVVYLANHSLPHSSVGYSTRTQGLLSALGSAGWDVPAVTSLGYPYHDWPSTDTTTVPAVEQVGNVSYHRLVDDRRRYPRWPLQRYVDDYAERVAEIATQARAGVIHAASNYVNGLAAVTVAHRLGLPCVYEVRGLWELSRSAREPEYNRSERFQLSSGLETAACHAADHVIAITGGLRAELVRRGVPAEKITVLPNGVDLSRFETKPREQELAAELGVDGKTVIGYVGSILDYEGIDTLLHATARLRERRTDFHVLIVGDGVALDEVKELSASLGVGDVVTLTGRVPHEEVERYYSLVDIAPFPRKPLEVCEMVSPLKPFEAMAMGKVPVVSSVAALTEIVTDGENGLVFTKGDVGALAAALERLLADDALRRDLGRAAQQWVATERDWSALVPTLEGVYGRVRATGARLPE